MGYIRDLIDRLDAAVKAAQNAEQKRAAKNAKETTTQSNLAEGGNEEDNDIDDDDDDDSDFKSPTNLDNGHFKLSSRPQGHAQTVEEIQAAHQDDDAFTSFRRRLSKFLTNTFTEVQIPLPDGKNIKLTNDHPVRSYLDPTL